MSLEAKLERVVVHYEEVRALTAAYPDPASPDYARLMKEYAELTPIVEQIHVLRRAQQEMAELTGLLEDPDQEPEMRTLVEAELREAGERYPKLERRLRLMLLPKDEADDRNVVLEVRAGTGGDEAGLFAADLFRMYQRYAEARGWRFEPLNASESGVGGYREASAAISGRGVFARLKFESGAHRVQRVPATESGG